MVSVTFFDLNDTHNYVSDMEFVCHEVYAEEGLFGKTKYKDECISVVSDV